MKKTFLILTLITFLALKGFGQIADTSFYPSGELKAIKLKQGDKIVRATIFKESGEEKYKWDIERKVLISYDAISYLDTLAEYFKSICPTYTLYQHYGNGPLRNIENFKDNVRSGEYVEYSRKGSMISKGQFKNWEKTGIWSYYDDKGKADKHIHWFHHSFHEGGISINYTVVPITVTVILIISSLFLCLRTLSFSSFFISYSLFTIGVFIVLYFIGHLLREETLLTFSAYTRKIFFPVMTTLVMTMLFCSLTALIIRRKTGVKPVYSISFLLISFGLGFVLLSAYMASKMTGFVM